MTGYVSVASAVLAVAIAFVLGALFAVARDAAPPAAADLGDPVRPIPAGRVLAGAGCPRAGRQW